MQFYVGPYDGNYYLISTLKYGGGQMWPCGMCAIENSVIYITAG